MRAILAHDPRRRLALRQFTALAAGAALACVAHGEGPQVIRVHARKFTFTPDHITLKRGVPVVFELTGQDTLMGFSIPDFSVRADVVPGQTARLALTPDRTGTFEFLCDIFCGTGHETMNGTLVVT
ncbi:cupredoxin domain-containing protein [Ralstonia pseudosolanacearum]|uniref:cupredoxin domain-containing protein n=1 Tax=Ralstonia solanacearum species complex TaxID=3116862 RepID=UPI0018D0D6E2|nr:cytochrome c oxidase subunit II [Ralstonia pseudosolanacearum]